VAGETLLTAALTGTAASPTSTPPVSASRADGGWVLEGTELAVPQAHVAARVVVPAHTPEHGVLLALVDPAAPGVTLERTVTTNREIHPHLHLDGVAIGADEVLAGAGVGDGASPGPEGQSALDAVLVAATVGLCALQVGVCEAALRQTAAYLNTRHQFGRPLSTFQSTLLRAADAAIDIEAMRVTWQNAAWRFDTGRDASDAARVAKWQASERGQRAVHATQHLHGGIGADVSYPIHRYFLWGKQFELQLGGPSAQLSHLGRHIAESAKARAGAKAGAGAAP
jgi:alkylation response protein AidB-like acyl-CoA dehydrogenase